jgi:hypothetical protein
VPLPLAPLVAALLGVAFGLVGRDEVRRTSVAPTSTRGFLIVTLVSIFLLVPALAYFVAFYPDWAYAYYVPGEQIPSAVDLVEIVGIAAIPPVMYAWVANALRRHAVRELVRGVGALVLLLAVAVAVVGARLGVADTYDAFREGIEPKPIGGSSLGVSVLWIDGCLIAGAMWAGAQLRRMGRG